jgi:hypothetical protein
MKKSKKIIVHTIALIWFIFSFVYIGYDIFKKQELREIDQQTYENGQNDIKNKLIEDTKNCDSATLYQGENPVQFIRASCQNKTGVNGEIYKGPTSPPPSK